MLEQLFIQNAAANLSQVVKLDSCRQPVSTYLLKMVDLSVKMVKKLELTSTTAAPVGNP